MGLTAMGFLCIFFRKYTCWVLGGGSVSRVRYFLVVESMIPSCNMESTYVLIAVVSDLVGSVSIFS